MQDENYSRLAAKRFRQYLREDREKEKGKSEYGSRGQTTLYAIMMEMIKFAIQFLQSVGAIKKKRSERVIVE